MKTKVFALLLAGGIGLGTLQANTLNSTLKFTTADGKVLEMELAHEPEYREELPEVISRRLMEISSDPENHSYFQALVRQLQREEEPEPLPFRLD